MSAVRAWITALLLVLLLFVLGALVPAGVDGLLEVLR